jgi:hypothetical protein
MTEPERFLFVIIFTEATMDLSSVREQKMKA